MTVSYPESIVSILSCSRLRKYLKEAENLSPDDEIKMALRLYAWNTALSASLYGPLQALEIALRNAVDKQLTDAFGENWYDRRNVVNLNKASVEKIDKAKEENNTRDGIISDLSLGFWTPLFRNKVLWNKELHKIFFSDIPTKKQLEKKRKNLEYRLKKFKDLRNRIAHHEPIFHQDLKQDIDDILGILSWISPQKRAWVEYYSRLSDVLKMRPPDDEELKF